MQNEIVVTLPGEPRGKSPPRSRVAWTKSDQPFVAVYTDKATRDYKVSLAWAAKAAMKGHRVLEGPIIVNIVAAMSVPKSWSMKERDAALTGVVRPIGRPDLDN